MRGVEKQTKVSHRLWAGLQTWREYRPGEREREFTSTYSSVPFPSIFSYIYIYIYRSEGKKQLAKVSSTNERGGFRLGENVVITFDSSGLHAQKTVAFQSIRPFLFKEKKNVVLKRRLAKPTVEHRSSNRSFFIKRVSLHQLRSFIITRAVLTRDKTGFSTTSHPFRSSPSSEKNES